MRESRATFTTSVSLMRCIIEYRLHENARELNTGEEQDQWEKQRQKSTKRKKKNSNKTSNLFFFFYYYYFYLFIKHSHMLSRSSIFHSMREFRSSFTFYFSQSKLVASHNEMPNQFYLQIFSSSRQCFTRFFTFENVSVAWKRFLLPILRRDDFKFLSTPARRESYT